MIIGLDLETAILVPFETSHWQSTTPIACIAAYNVDEDKSFVWSADEDIKRPSLSAFAEEFAQFAGHKVVTYNGSVFDLPLIRKRLGLPINYWSQFQHIDLCAEVQRAVGRRMKLQNVLSGTFGQNKLMNGALAPEKWQQFLYDEVVEYCADDARQTALLYRHAIDGNSLRVRLGSGVREFKLNFQS